jgi:hypothetical protein
MTEWNNNQFMQILRQKNRKEHQMELEQHRVGVSDGHIDENEVQMDEEGEDNYNEDDDMEQSFDDSDLQNKDPGTFQILII